MLGKGRRWYKEGENLGEQLYTMFSLTCGEKEYETQIDGFYSVRRSIDPLKTEITAEMASML